MTLIKNISNKNKSRTQYDQNEDDYAMQMQSNNYGFGYKSSNGDEFDIPMMNGKPLQKKNTYPSANQYEWEQNNYKGPFEVK